MTKTAILAAFATLITLLGSAHAQVRQFMDEGPDSAFHIQERSTAWEGMTHGDIDGDGDVDIVYALYTTDPSRPSLLTARNDGSGRFHRCTQCIRTRTRERRRHLRLRDMDGDGDLDLLHAPYNNRAWIFANDGRGNFAPPASLQLPALGTLSSRLLAVEDLDGDQDMDIILGAEGQSEDQVLLNAGNWRFTAGHRFAGSSRSTVHATVTDADGDGVKDVLLAALGQEPKLWYGNRNGSFSAGPTFAVGDWPAAIFVDLTGNGALELVISNSSNWTTGIFARQGPRTYRLAASLPYGAHYPLDFDRDGDVDLVTSNLGFLRNDGALQFRSVQILMTLPGQSKTLAVSIVDVDNDQDDDVLLMVHKQAGTWPFQYLWWSPRVLRNRELELYAPRTVPIGGTADVEIHGTTGGQVVLGLGLQEIRVSLGTLGDLRIDPATAVFLPRRRFAQSPMTARFSVPSDPRLIGMRPLWQAMLVPRTQPPRLTRMVPTTITR